MADFLPLLPQTPTLLTLTKQPKGTNASAADSLQVLISTSGAMCPILSLPSPKWGLITTSQLNCLTTHAQGQRCLVSQFLMGALSVCCFSTTHSHHLALYLRGDI